MHNMHLCAQRLRATRARRLCTTFYDSQSGRTVTVPSGVQCHVSLSAVATNRRPSALAHLVRDGSPVKGIASVLTAAASSAAGVAEAAQSGHSEVCIEVRDLADGVSAVKAALELSLRPRVVLTAALSADPYDVQLNTAELGDAGAEAIFLTVSHDHDLDALREAADLACEIDLLGVPMRSRLGLRVAPGASTASLLNFAHDELQVLHYWSCLAGEGALVPSELLAALGVRKPDQNFGAIVLAEHVPGAG